MAICGAPPFERFIHYAIHSHYSEFRDLLQVALASDSGEAVINAARQITLGELYEVGVGSDALHIRYGTETMRRAAVSIYARNLSNNEVGNKCVEHLEHFFNDDSEDVRKKASQAFFKLSGKKLLEFESFISRFVESESFETDPYSLIHALEDSNVELPKIISRAAQRILEFVGEEGSYISSNKSMVAYSISKLIIRQYEQSEELDIKKACLDLIDRMEHVGYLGIDDELSSIDR